MRYLFSGWRETHSGCKLAGSAATSLKSKKVLSVAQRPRLRAFFDFALSRTNHPIFASKAVSRQPLFRNSHHSFPDLLSD